MANLPYPPADPRVVIPPLPAPAPIPAPHIHYDDPRYQQWRKVYDAIVNDTPPPLREVLKSSAGTLASAVILALFPEAP